MVKKKYHGILSVCYFLFADITKKLCNQSQQKPDGIKIWLQGVFGTTAPTVPPE